MILILWQGHKTYKTHKIWNSTNKYECQNTGAFWSWPIYRKLLQWIKCFNLSEDYRYILNPKLKLKFISSSARRVTGIAWQYMQSVVFLSFWWCDVSCCLIYILNGWKQIVFTYPGMQCKNVHMKKENFSHFCFWFI